MQVASITSAISVGAERSKTICSGTLKKGSLSCLDVVTSPGFEDGGLKSTTVRERDSPGSLVVDLVDGVQVKASVLLRLASRKEHNSGNSGHVSASENANGSLSDLLTASGLSRPLSSGGDHVRLDDSSLNDELMGLHLLHNACKNKLRDSLTVFDRMVSIKADFGLNNGH